MAFNVLKSFIFLDYNQIGLEVINSSLLCFYILFICLFLFWDKGSLCSPQLPGTCYVGHTGLELIEANCLCLPSTEIICHYIWPNF